MATWLQDVVLEAGQQVRWSVGTCVVCLRRTADEWLLSTEHGGEPQRELVAEVSDGTDAIEGERRFSADSGPGTVRLRPVVPTRALVARPESPLTILPGREVIAFVGVPLCLRIELADGTVLDEVLSLMLSDTWFGSSVEGTLCYATKTHLTRDRAALETRAHRAVCEVVAHNATAEALTIERLRIPAPTLEVFTDGQDHLWTSRVSFHRTGGESEASVDIGPHPSMERLTPARSPAEPGLVKVFNALWPVSRAGRI